MKTIRTRAFLMVAALCLSLGVSGQTPSTKTGSAPKAAVAAPSGMPNAGEIANAKAKGLVWTNPTTKVFHKDGEFYGKTKNGKFMTESEAVKQYYRPAPDASRKNSTAKTDPPKTTPLAAANTIAPKAAAPPAAKKK